MCVARTSDLSEIGVLASLAGSLAEAGISIFVVSTFDTDYLMVREADLERVIAVLGEAGHEVLKTHCQINDLETIAYLRYPSEK